MSGLDYLYRPQATRICLYLHRQRAFAIQDHIAAVSEELDLVEAAPQHIDAAWAHLIARGQR